MSQKWHHLLRLTDPHGRSLAREMIYLLTDRLPHNSGVQGFKLPNPGREVWIGGDKVCARWCCETSGRAQLKPNSSEVAAPN